MNLERAFSDTQLICSGARYALRRCMRRWHRRGPERFRVERFLAPAFRRMDKLRFLHEHGGAAAEDVAAREIRDGHRDQATRETSAQTEPPRSSLTHGYGHRQVRHDLLKSGQLGRK